MSVSGVPAPRRAAACLGAVAGPVRGRSSQQGFLVSIDVDGAHAEVHAQNDYAGWAPWLMNGGALVVHDVFPDPADGGQAPYRILLRALGSGFTETAVQGSMRVLTRVEGQAGDPVQ